MKFIMPEYKAPDFTRTELASAPDCRLEAADMDGVAPEYYHSTSMFPEYFKINGTWRLAEESRMDSSVIIRPDGRLDVIENRNIKKGDLVVLGRSEDGHEGIYVHANGFEEDTDGLEDQFVFRQGRSRETSYARDYDRLFGLLNYEREHGKIVWVMGPAFAFDYDARTCMQALVEMPCLPETHWRHMILKGQCFTRRSDRIFTRRDPSQTGTTITLTWTTG